MLSNIVSRLLILTGWILKLKLLLKTRNPEKEQFRVLMNIIKAQANTEYGKEHHFHKIRSIEDFRKYIPINEYEDLRSYIDKQEETGKPYLNSEKPIYYALTSGTTGHKKRIPVTLSVTKKFKRDQKIFYHVVSQVNDNIWQQACNILSPCFEEYTEHGVICGSMGGFFAKSMPNFIKKHYLLMESIYQIPDYHLKYMTIALLALSNSQVTFLSAPNPSTILSITQVINENFHELVQSIEKGKFCLEEKLSDEVKEYLFKKIKPDVRRAKELMVLKEKHKEIKIKHIWPNLMIFVTWTGGSCGIFISKIENQFDPSIVIQNLGYIASEFRGTLPYGVGRAGKGMPTFNTNFFEFIEVSDYEDKKFVFKLLHELEVNKRYYVFVTTPNGLYRYNMNDILETSGRYNKVPLLSFSQKGKGVTNITGEKLYESQLVEAISKAEDKFNLQATIYKAFADEHNANYIIYYEPIKKSSATLHKQLKYFESEIDNELAVINMEYKAKRASKRLKKPQLKILKPNTYDKYKAFCVNNGQREGQFKIIALSYLRDQKFKFDQYTIG